MKTGLPIMIAVEHLTKTFGQVVAVSDISFEIKRSEIVAFLGPNGTGKTTTIKMLTTLLKPTSGKIELDGLNAEREPGEVRKRFGIVFQDPSLDDELTAQENMEIHAALYQIPRRDCAERIEKLLELLELWERRKEPAKRFSDGMDGRLEIARGLLHSPRVMFLDSRK